MGIKIASKTKALPTISLLILNYNGMHITPIILDSVKHLRYPSEKLEVIVIDNASVDGSVAMIRAKYPFAKIIQRDKNIAYPAMNDGVAVCKGEYCFLLNNDIEMHPDSLLEMVKAAQIHADTVMLSPAMYHYDSRRLQYTIKYISRSFYNGSDHGQDFTEQQNEEALSETYTGVPFIKTSFARSMPFVVDPDYFLCGDDIDLGYRVRLMGHTIYRVPKAKLYHKPGSTVLATYKNPHLAFFVERNSLQTFVKNLQVHNLILLFPYFCAVHLFNLMLNIATMRFRNAYELAHAWCWNFVHLQSLLHKRTLTQRLRKAPDKVIFKAMMNEKGVFTYLFGHMFLGKDKFDKK